MFQLIHSKISPGNARDDFYNNLSLRSSEHKNALDDEVVHVDFMQHITNIPVVQPHHHQHHQHHSSSSSSSNKTNIGK